LVFALNLDLRRADQVLHVVADFVRDDVGLREITRRAETAFHHFVEAWVDVELAIARAVERADIGAGAAAAFGSDAA
jgi:hypothetical protein